MLVAITITVNAGNLPSDWRELALDAVKARLRDPSSVQMLQVVDIPRYSDRSSDPDWWCVTVLCNAKNGFGGYTGPITWFVYFRRNGHVDAYEVGPM